MSIRVLFVTTCYPLKPGDSIPGFVADLAQALVQSGRGIQVRVITPHHAGAAHRETVNGVEIERFQYALDADKQCLAVGGGIPDNLRTYPRAKWQIPGFLASMTRAIHRNLRWADLIHAHWVEPAFMALAANFLHRRPLVVTVHSLKPKRSRLHAFTLRRADRVLFNSAYTMAQAERSRYRCDGQVVYQGFDASSFGNLERTGEMRKRLGIPPDATLVAAVGRLIEVKGLHVLAQAADQALTSRPSAHIAIAGYGPLQQQIEQIIARSATKDRIHLAGTLDRREVAQLLADSDLFVNPGVLDARGRAEGLGITTLEALASGLPVVASRVGGIPETIVDGVTALLVPPGDASALARAVGELLDDEPSRKRMGETGRKHVQQRFAWPALADQVADVYGEVLASRNRAASRAQSATCSIVTLPQKRELDTRLDAYRRIPDAGTSWEDVKHEIKRDFLPLTPRHRSVASPLPR
jgi:glycosyltransferase involved in cell wall biosynthesis